jgi:hypothetical protein
MKNAVLSDVTPCGSCMNRRFGGTYCLYHQGDKNQRARNNVSNEAHCAAGRFLQEPHGVTSHEDAFFRTC